MKGQGALAAVHDLLLPSVSVKKAPFSPAAYWLLYRFLLSFFFTSFLKVPIPPMQT